MAAATARDAGAKLVSPIKLSSRVSHEQQQQQQQAAYDEGEEEPGEDQPQHRPSDMAIAEAAAAALEAEVAEESEHVEAPPALAKVPSKNELEADNDDAAADVDEPEQPGQPEQREEPKQPVEPEEPEEPEQSEQRVDREEDDEAGAHKSRPQVRHQSGEIEEREEEREEREEREEPEKHEEHGGTETSRRHVQHDSEIEEEEEEEERDENEQYQRANVAEEEEEEDDEYRERNHARNSAYQAGVQTGSHGSISSSSSSSSSDDGGGGWKTEGKSHPEKHGLHGESGKGGKAGKSGRGRKSGKGGGKGGASKGGKGKHKHGRGGEYKHHSHKDSDRGHAAEEDEEKAVHHDGNHDEDEQHDDVVIDDEEQHDKLREEVNGGQQQQDDADTNEREAGATDGLHEISSSQHGDEHHAEHHHGGGGGGGRGGWSSLPLLNRHELDSILPQLGAGGRVATLAANGAAAAKLAAAEAKMRGKREKLLGQIRRAKPGGSEERRLMNQWNIFMPARNAALYPTGATSAIAILLLVHERTMYLEPALRLYSRVHGINETTLIVSHHGACVRRARRALPPHHHSILHIVCIRSIRASCTHPTLTAPHASTVERAGTHRGVWKVVEAARFCRVRQLIFPLGGGRDNGGAGFRGVPALKLHFTWAVSYVVGQLEVSDVLYMEDDYWPTPDLYRHAVWMRAMRQQHCPECPGSVLGDHPRDWTERHTDSSSFLGGRAGHPSLYRAFVGCPFNSPAGLLLPATTWQVVIEHAAAYCDRAIVPYDDAIHALQNGGRGRKRVLEPGWLTAAFPRCLHVGRCGGVSFRAEEGGEDGEGGEGGGGSARSACNVSADLETFVHAWVSPMLPGGELSGTSKGSLKWASTKLMPKHPRKAWHIGEGISLCRSRYVADEETGQLAGVAQPPTTAAPGSNGTTRGLPMRFQEACLAMIKQNTL